MRYVICLIGIVLVLDTATTVSADDAVKRRIMFAEYAKGPSRPVEPDAEGKLGWEYKIPSIADIYQPLSNGHVLFGYGGST